MYWLHNSVMGNVFSVCRSYLSDFCSVMSSCFSGIFHKNNMAMSSTVSNELTNSQGHSIPLKGLYIGCKFLNIYPDATLIIQLQHSLEGKVETFHHPFILKLTELDKLIQCYDKIEVAVDEIHKIIKNPDFVDSLTVKIENDLGYCLEGSLYLGQEQVNMVSLLLQMHHFHVCNNMILESYNTQNFFRVISREDLTQFVNNQTESLPSTESKPEREMEEESWDDLAEHGI